MNALPIRLLLLIKDGVLVLGQHLLLPGHLIVPPVNGPGALSVPLQGCAEGIDDAVDGAQTLTLPGFLGLRDAPWGLPVREIAGLVSFLLVLCAMDGGVCDTTPSIL